MMKNGSVGMYDLLNSKSPLLPHSFLPSSGAARFHLRPAVPDVPAFVQKQRDSLHNIMQDCASTSI